MSIMFRCGHCIAIASLAAVFSSITLRCHGQLSPQEQFLREAPAAWSDAETMNRNIEIVVSETLDNRTEDKRWTQRRQAIVKARDNMILQQLMDSPSDGGQAVSRVDAINFERSFALRRQGDAPWTVDYVGPTDDTTTLQTIDRKGRKMILWPWYIGDWFVPKMYRSGGFHLQSVESVKEDGVTLAKVSFGYRPSDANDPFFIRDGSWMLLDPSQHWSIRRCEVQMGNRRGEAVKITMSSDYRENDDAAPRSGRMVLDHIGRPRGVVQSVEFAKYERRLVPEHDFTLSAFGLPEVREPPLFARGRMWMVLVAVGIACIVIAIWIRARATAT